MSVKEDMGLTLGRTKVELQVSQNPFFKTLDQLLQKQQALLEVLKISKIGFSLNQIKSLKKVY
jgi:hypothetical protein|tara:strand:+ start:111 stop:299 length:189 start_codon:yes stop_codon:yes gene_type:complete